MVRQQVIAKIAVGEKPPTSTGSHWNIKKVCAKVARVQSIEYE